MAATMGDQPGHGDSLFPEQPRPRPRNPYPWDAFVGPIPGDAVRHQPRLQPGVPADWRWPQDFIHDLVRWARVLPSRIRKDAFLQSMGATLSHDRPLWAPLYCMTGPYVRRFIAGLAPMGATLLHDRPLWAPLYCMKGHMGATLLPDRPLWAPLYCMTGPYGRHFIASPAPMGATLLHDRPLLASLYCMTGPYGQLFIA